MSYVFDTGIFILMFRHYYPDRFPKLWEKFAFTVTDKSIISVREVLRELGQVDDDASVWAKNNDAMFPEPSGIEADFVAQIFREHTSFQQLITNKARLKANPCADPFVIAKAYVEKKCVVTSEKYSDSKVKIPNVCEKYKIECTDLEGFMKREEWKF